MTRLTQEIARIIHQIRLKFHEDHACGRCSLSLWSALDYVVYTIVKYLLFEMAKRLQHTQNSGPHAALESFKIASKCHHTSVTLRPKENLGQTKLSIIGRNQFMAYRNYDCIFYGIINYLLSWYLAYYVYYMCCCRMVYMYYYAYMVRMYRICKRLLLTPSFSSTFETYSVFQQLGMSS